MTLSETSIETQGQRRRKAERQEMEQRPWFGVPKLGEEKQRVGHKREDGPKGRKTDTAVLTRNQGWGERDGQSRLRGQGRQRETETSAAVTHQACLGQGGGDEQREETLGWPSEEFCGCFW